MRKIITILIILFYGLNVFSQITPNNWTHLKVTNKSNDWEASYLIKKTNEDSYIFNDSNRCQKRIIDSLITVVFNSLDNKYNENDPLLMFNRDSTWLKNNAEKLWSDYKYENSEIIKPKYDSIATTIIKDYNNIKNIIRKSTGLCFYNNKISPNYASLIIYNDKDSLNIITISRCPYMLPFEVNDKIIFNSNLSSVISSFIDYKGWPNSYLMSGTRFNNQLIENIYYSYISPVIEFEKVKEKYPSQLKKLSEYFQVDYAELPMMGSIEFGGFMGRNCMELYLSDSTISKNIRYTPVFGKRIFLHSVNPLVKKKSKILEQLKNNPIYNYVLTNENVIGEIHFVNKKSFSNTAKRNFRRDLKEKNIDEKQFKGKFKNAVFFSLRETKEEKTSSSRWILLKDGTNILWDFTGSFLMNLPSQYTLEKGYVCKVIPNELLK